MNENPFKSLVGGVLFVMIVSIHLAPPIDGRSLSPLPLYLD